MNETVSRILPNLSEYIMHVSGDEKCDLCNRQFIEDELCSLSISGVTCGNVELCWKTMGCGMDISHQNEIVFPRDNPTQTMIDHLAGLGRAKPLFLSDFGFTMI